MRKTDEIDLLKKTKQLAEWYTPNWNFSTENPDPGSVVAILGSEMLAESRKRFGMVLGKHKIQYLNLFDRIKEEPIESARSYVRFFPVNGVEEPVNIPKGTELLAQTEESGEIMFETLYGISAIDAKLAAVYVTDRNKDYIAPLFNSVDNPEKTPFIAFDLSRDNQSEHVMLLGFESLFDDLERVNIALEFAGTSEEEAAEAAAIFAGEDVEIGMLSEEGFMPFENRQLSGNRVILSSDSIIPTKTTEQNETMYFIAVRASKLADQKLSGLSVVTQNEELIPQEVYTGGILQNPGHFYPFGSPMEIYAECGIENKEVFARKGAKVKLSFNLSFETIEQLLPEYEESEELKIVMRKQRTPLTPAIAEVKPDYVLLEYYGERGWRRLIEEEQAALLFNGSLKGEVSLEFVMPEDMADSETFTGDYRLRLRLIKADNLYQLPVRQHIPVIDEMQFSYSYEEAPILPSTAMIRNNYIEENVTEQIKNRRTLRPFFNNELQKPAMYMGFEGAFWGTPVSLYLDVENYEDYPIDFTVEYLSQEGFIPLKVADNTKGFRYSETILAMIPADIAKKELFGEELHWLRFICHNRDIEKVDLPTVKAVYTNMVQVQNHRTKVETFYVEDIDTTVNIQLEEGDIIGATIYVNERDKENETDENWVKWTKQKFTQEQGRVYDIDPVVGSISFSKGVFAKYPINENAAAIKVEYQSYQGAAANVPEGSISTLNRSIKYISSVTNPMAAYGGYDGYNERTSAAIISNMLRTRGRAVSHRDFFDIISQISYGVRRIKCCNGIDQYGNTKDDTITIAVLIDEYKMGGHIFSSVKEQIREKILESSSILPLGKSLILSQPYFVRLSLRLWTQCEKMENAYDLQKETSELINEFIDPLSGGFSGEGWEIGTIPTVAQIIAYVKTKQPDIGITNVALTAHFGKNEFAVNDEIHKKIKNPFAMAVNGEHIIYVELAPE